MATFDTLTASDARGLLRAPAWLAANRAFLGVPTAEDPDAEPDHWQDGDGFAGPLPSAGDPNRTAYMAALEGTFVSEDCLSDVATRRRNGVLGKEPGWAFEVETAPVDEMDAPEPEEAEGDAEETPADPRLAGITAAVAEWWDERGGHDLLKRYVDVLSYGGRAYLRVFLSAGSLTTGEDGAPRFPPGTTVQDALRSIYAEVVDAEQAIVHVDRATQRKLGVFVAAEDEAEDATRVKPDATAEPPVYAEFVYLDGDGADAKTVIRTTRSSADTVQAVTLDLRGHLTLYEGRAPALIDAPMRSNQRDLNTKRTFLSISESKAAFPSLVFINVKPPTEEVVDANGEKQEVATGYENGPGQVGFFTGHAERDADGTLRFASGSVTQFGPVDNSNLRESADVARTAIYRRARQLHALALKGANLSGEAMIQGQGEFYNDLMDVKGAVDRAGKWLLETVYALAEVLSGAAEPTKDVRCVFDCRPSAGPVSAALRQRILEEYKEGVISRETAQSLLGIDDVDAEAERLEREQRATVRMQAEETAALFGNTFAAPTFGEPGGDGLPDDVSVNPNNAT